MSKNSQQTTNVDIEPAEKPKGCLDKLKMKVSTLDKICAFLAELIGTGLLVFLGCMGCVKNAAYENNHLQMTFNFGLVVMVIIQSFGCVSGAHLNPAVTLAAYIYNMLSLTMAALYVVAQLFGAFIGYGLLKSLIPTNAVYLDGPHNLCVTTVHSDISPWQGCAIEFIISGVLIFVCCGVWDPRNAKFHDSVPIRFGLAIACLAITAGQFTGASMNPARSFAPALWNYDFEDNWIYWVGPMGGSAVCAIIYKAIFRREVAEEKGQFTGASMNPARSFAPALWNYDFEDNWIYWVGPMGGSAVCAIIYKAIFRREVAEEKVNNKLRAMEEVPLS